MPDLFQTIIKKDVQDLITANAKKAAANNQGSSNTTSGFTSPLTNQTTSTSNSSLQLMNDEIRLNGPENGGALEVGTSVNDSPSGLDHPKNASPLMKGRPSFFNPYYLIRYHSASKTNEDGENDSKQIRLDQIDVNGNYIGLADDSGYKNVSTSYILKYLSSNDELERRLSYADFVYMKNYHKFNNNRLIALRRFMVPVYDNLRIAYKKSNGDSYKKLSQPIAKALTYFGEGTDNKLSTLTNFDYGINTKNVTGEENVKSVAENDFTGVLGAGAKNALQKAGINLGSNGAISGTLGALGPGAIKLLAYLSDETDNGPNSTTGFASWFSSYDPWSQGPLSDLVYGPVNVVNSAKIRARGFSTTMKKYQVTFDYSLKYIGGLNPKAAMLDIMSNMLALTYNHANFWGGENRFLVDRQNFPLINQELFHKFLANPTSSGVKDVVQLLSQKVTTSFETIFAQISSAIEQGGQLSGEQIKQAGDLAVQLALSGNSQAKSLAKQIFEGQKGILTGAPTGEWHLQVGNPMAPIMMVGNLWCTGAKFQFSDELGIDDFPTELKVVVNLEDGRPRDSSDIESIFNSGGGRIYYPYANGVEVDPNNSYSTQNSESAIEQSPEDVIGSWNRFGVDRDGTSMSDLTLTPEARKTSRNNDNAYTQRSIYHRINEVLGKGGKK